MSAVFGRSCLGPWWPGRLLLKSGSGGANSLTGNVVLGRGGCLGGSLLLCVCVCGGWLWVLWVLAAEVSPFFHEGWVDWVAGEPAGLLASHHELFIFF